MYIMLFILTQPPKGVGLYYFMFYMLFSMTALEGLSFDYLLFFVRSVGRSVASLPPSLPHLYKRGSTPEPEPKNFSDLRHTI